MIQLSQVYKKQFLIWCFLVLGFIIVSKSSAQSFYIDPTSPYLQPRTNDAKLDPDSYLKQLILSGKSANALWSFSVRTDVGKEIIQFHSSKLITPASNLKLLSSALFLDQLSPNFVFETGLYGVGEQKGNTWDGDIIFYGTGDPSIGGEFYDGNKWYVFDVILKQLKALRIQRVTGSIIANTSFFDEEVTPPNWNWDDLSFYYAPEISPLSFNRNCIDLVVDATGTVGSKPKISWFPFNTDYVQFVNEQVILDRRSEYEEYYQRPSGVNTITLRSKVPQNYDETESLSISNPGLFFVDTFKKYAKDKFFIIEGGIKESNLPMPSNSKKLAFHRSKPLSEMIKRINKESDNFYVEMILKTLSKLINGKQGSTEHGVSLMNSFAQSMQMDSTNMYLKDASGMATSNLISTRDLSRLLVESKAKKWFPYYYESMTISGVDGSFKYRFKQTPLENNLRGKSGYISGARTIAGYLTTKRGTKLSFSLAANHFNEKVKGIDEIHQQFLLWVYENY